MATATATATTDARFPGVSADALEFVDFYYFALEICPERAVQVYRDGSVVERVDFDSSVEKATTLRDIRKMILLMGVDSRRVEFHTIQENPSGSMVEICVTGATLRLGLPCKLVQTFLLSIEGSEGCYHVYKDYSQLLLIEDSLPRHFIDYNLLTVPSPLELWKELHRPKRDILSRKNWAPCMPSTRNSSVEAPVGSEAFSDDLSPWLHGGIAYGGSDDLSPWLHGGIAYGGCYDYSQLFPLNEDSLPPHLSDDHLVTTPSRLELWKELQRSDKDILPRKNWAPWMPSTRNSSVQAPVGFEGSSNVGWKSEEEIAKEVADKKSPCRNVIIAEDCDPIQLRMLILRAFEKGLPQTINRRGAENSSAEAPFAAEAVHTAGSKSKETVMNAEGRLMRKPSDRMVSFGAASTSKQNVSECDTSLSPGYAASVKNVPLTTTRREIRKTFGQFGPLIRIQLKTEKTNNTASGFVVFESFDSMQRAIKASPISLGGGCDVIVAAKDEKTKHVCQCIVHSSRLEGFSSG